MHKIISEDISEIAAANLPWDKLAGKTILISGAAGFLPSYIAHSILHLNDNKRLHKPAKIIALVRNQIRAEQRFSEYIGRPDFRLIVQDVSDPLENVIEPLHYIVHAASPASPKYYVMDPIGTFSANVIGTKNLMEAAKNHPIECFLYFSSSEVYGQLPADINQIHETQYGYIDPLNLRSCYSEGKRMGETLCIAWAHQYGMPVKIVRPFHTYGPGMQLDDGRVFADFVADIANNRNIIMKSDGSAVRAFCYLVDATIAFFTVLLKGETNNAYNVGNNEAATSIANLAETLASLFPEKHLKVIQDLDNRKDYIPTSVNRNIPNISKLKALGWQPKYNIAQGFTRTVQSFLSGN